MDPTQVKISLAFVEIKLLCEHVVAKPGIGQPGGWTSEQVQFAEHILAIIKRNFKDDAGQAVKACELGHIMESCSNWKEALCFCTPAR